ncbi:molybdopterin-binding domain-containing protein [Entomobacter blattae]|uniref:Molybdopterin molybdenumtransferase n=1 Tax=Entomobacter blattae TaxID=2762277 RepID=A0A7H1NT33_9PROT|nr:hypothetical protein [Entomobacter blattae]QNT78943.1 hypothetical protein JGUZn3_17250 [Entomobacter blattae]
MDNFSFFGVRSLISQDDFLKIVNNQAYKQEIEDISLKEALGYYLAEDILMESFWPKERYALFNGILTQSELTEGASDYFPVVLDRRHQVRDIIAGEKITEEGDIIIPYADLMEENPSSYRVTHPFQPGYGIIPPGEVFYPQHVLLRKYTKIQQRHIDALHSFSISFISVYKQPLLRLIIIHKNKLHASWIKKTYRNFLKKYINQIECVQITEDNLEKCISEAVMAGQNIIIVGGSGWGKDDCSAPSVYAQGGENLLYGVAIEGCETYGLFKWQNPRQNGELFCHIVPSTPLSSLQVFVACIDPLLSLQTKHAPLAWLACKKTLASRLVSPVGVASYVPARLEAERVYPLYGQEIGFLQADGFIPIPDFCEGYAAGTDVDFIPLYS